MPGGAGHDCGHSSCNSCVSVDVIRLSIRMINLLLLYVAGFRRCNF